MFRAEVSNRMNSSNEPSAAIHEMKYTEQSKEAAGRFGYAYSRGEGVVAVVGFIKTKKRLCLSGDHRNSLFKEHV
jgi:hypothetical protein